MKSLELVHGILACSCSLLLVFVPFGALTEPVEGDSDLDSTAGRIIYDQRQTGKYNIHVSIKDVAIIEMDQNEIEDESYNEGDYYYDEGDLTVKPLPTRPSTTVAVEKHNLTTSTTTISDTTEDITAPSSYSSSGDSTNIPLVTKTYSPNLLADIAATQAGVKRTTNVVIIDSTTTQRNSPTSTHMPSVVAAVTQAELTGRSKDIPLIHSRQNLFNMRAKEPTGQQHYSQLDMARSIPETPVDSKIYKFKARRSGVPYPMLPLHGHARRCRSNQYRDVSGACRIKRSSSILKKLFSMLVSLPLASERSHDNE